MLVHSDVVHDARVRRSARTAAKAGLEVIVLGSAARDEQPRVTVVEGVAVHLVEIPLLKQKAKEAARTAKARRREVRQLVAAGRSPGHGTIPLRVRHKRALARARDEAERAQEEARQLADDVVRPLARFEYAWLPLVRRLRPDLIHVHDFHGLSVIDRLSTDPSRERLRWIYDAHEYVRGLDLGASRDGVLRLEERLAPSADAVVTVSDSIAERLHDELHLPEHPTVVANTPSRNDAEPAPSSLRASIGLDESTPLLVYAGRIGRRRRLDVAVRALAQLADVHLALVTDSPPAARDELLTIAAEVDTAERVHFVPQVAPTQVAGYLSAASAGLHPLDRYTNGDLALPNKLFDYLHAGIPVVVSDTPTMAAFVRTHRLGAVASVDDVAAWANAIEEVLTHPSAYRPEPEAYLDLCRLWSWETQGQRLADLYRAVISRRPRGLGPV
jgi:glycosyltransferase involved in cell wall biosynthesis